MPVCRFSAAEIKRCIEHARAATEFDMGYESMTDAEYESIGLTPPTDRTPVGPCLLFVHDRGVYIMSNGIPRDLNESGDGSYVVYAEHCNPSADEDWYDTSRELVGGSDFVETIPIPRSWVDACDQFETFEIVIDDNTMNSGFINPVTPATS